MTAHNKSPMNKGTKDNCLEVKPNKITIQTRIKYMILAFFMISSTLASLNIKNNYDPKVK